MRHSKPSIDATAAQAAAKAGVNSPPNGPPPPYLSSSSKPSSIAPYAGISSSKAVPAYPLPLGWFAYVRLHFRQTRGPLAFGLAAAILLAPLLSLFKPVVGHGGLAALAIGLALLAVTLYVVYVAGLTKSYVSSSAADRWLRGDETSGLAMLAWSCLWLAIGIGPATFAEWHSPPDGWLVEFVPELRDEQVRWLGAQPRTAPTPVAVESPVSVPPPSSDTGNPFELEDEAVMPPSSMRSGTPAANERLEAAPRKDDQNPFETDP